MHTIALLVLLSATQLQAGPAADRVLVVTLDGLRWQELFGGAQRELISRPAGGVADTTGTLRRFWRETGEARREALMPFLWGVVAGRGRILGDSAGGSVVRVSNGKRFSYPGYNELLSGAPDDRINSNDKIANPNVTVLEWLNRRPAFRGKVAAFGSWDVLPFIVNAARSGIHTNGDGPPVSNPATPVERALNDLAADLPPYWGTVRFDAVTMQGALYYLKTRRPRVLYVMLGDTDEWAHERRYDLYLDAAQRGDRFLRTLWETVQAMPGYRDRTALIVATDHGRGSGMDWTDHGREVPAAERVWVAILKPSALSRQPSAVNGNFTQAQFAATIAGLLGLEKEFRAANPRAAPALSP
ncbi:MAG TPA: alkaline phosphatase family protein [Gemmatimonadales bacterium]|nr:alkaline phosphatase family protein [Gemmatimonadales bacterium]